MRAPVFEKAAWGLFLLLLVWAPWPLGSNRPWAWAILATGLFVALGLWTVSWARGEVTAFGALPAAWPALIVFGGWLAYLALHWIPLPAPVVGLLSPQAAALHELAGAYRQRPDWITLSIDPDASHAFWLRSCALGAAFFLALALARTRDRARGLAIALVASGVVQAVYAATMHLTGTDLTIFGTQIVHSGQASGGFVNRNHLAGFLEMTLAMGIGLMIGSLEDSRARTWRRFWRDLADLMLSPKVPLRLFLVAMVVALVMTRSRMGNTAFFSSLLVAGGVALALSRHATRSTVILIASLIVVDIFIVGAWFGVEKTLDRIEQTTADEVARRQNPSAYAMGMARDYPVFGTGAGSFYTAFTRYRGEDIAEYYNHAENDYAQFLVETGGIGVILVGLLPLMALGCAVLALARRRDPLARGFAFAVVMGVIAIGIHSTVDFNLQIPANALTFTVLLAFGWIALYLDRADNGGSRRPSPPRPPQAAP